MTDTTTDTKTDTNHIDFQTDQYLVRKYVSRILTRFHRFRDSAGWNEFRCDGVLDSLLLGLPEEDRHRWRRLESEDIPQLRKLLLKLEE